MFVLEVVIALRFGKGHGSRQEPSKDKGEFRINEEIRVRQVRLVGPNGEMVGVVPIENARDLARENELDLVEVSPSAEPPVCKVLDYGKFKYEQKKREHEAKRKQAGGDMKEVRFRPKTDTHDRQIKIARARRFLNEGHRVQVTLLFRGRELQHARELTENILNEVSSELGDIAKIERAISREGKRAFMSLMPKVVNKKGKSSKKSDEPADTKNKKE